MDVISQIGAVVGVLALLGGVLYVLRARGLATFSGGSTFRGPRRLRSVERLPLTPQHTLHLVRNGDRLLLLAASPGGCTLLETSPCDQAEVQA